MTLVHHTTHGLSDTHPIVFLHGWPFNKAQWRPQIEFVSQTHHAVALDLRGQGASPAEPGPQMIEFLVDDVIALLDHLQITRACVCGLSMGGYVALRLVDREPDRVHGLVLADTRAGADDNAGRVKRAGAIRLIQEHGMGAMAQKLMPALFPAEALDAQGAGVEAIRAMIEAADPIGACQALGAMACRLDLTGRLASIRTPTLVVVGEHDTITPPADAEAMQQAIARAQLVRIPGAGHVSNLSNDAAFNRALHEFLMTL